MAAGARCSQMTYGIEFLSELTSPHSIDWCIAPNVRLHRRLHLYSIRPNTLFGLQNIAGRANTILNQKLLPNCNVSQPHWRNAIGDYSVDSAESVFHHIDHQTLQRQPIVIICTFEPP